jgi:hypothetical protein
VAHHIAAPGEPPFLGNAMAMMRQPLESMPLSASSGAQALERNLYLVHQHQIAI